MVSLLDCLGDYGVGIIIVMKAFIECLFCLGTVIHTSKGGFH